MYIFIYSSSWPASSHYTQNLNFCTRILIVLEACEFVALRGLLQQLPRQVRLLFQIEKKRGKKKGEKKKL